MTGLIVGPVAGAVTRQRAGPAARWICSLGVAVVIAASLLRTGVGAVDMLRYVGYWGVAVILPGLVVSRALLGPRRTLIEDVSVAGATGVSLEIIAWMAGVALGLGDTIRFWWVPVLVAAAVVAPWRRRIVARVDERLPVRHSVALSAAIVLVIMRVDVGNFRVTPLPPRPSTIFLDNWWQLSLVQELMRYERPQVPQVAGEPLNYHYFANIHIASAARLSGVLPEVVLFRLWLVPVVIISIGLAFALGRVLTSSAAGGVATAWLAYAIPVGVYLWPELTTVVMATGTPILFHSPSQIMGNVGIMSGALGTVLLLRSGSARGLRAWLFLVLVGASGMKSTILPILLAGTVLAWVRAAIIRSRRSRALALLASVLVLLLLASLRVASGNSGGAIVLLGTLRSFRVYAEAVNDTTMRAVNSGILLDSIDSGRALAFAGLGVLLFIGIHTPRLLGVLSLARRRTRGDLVTWWLAGAVLAGYAAVFVLDHIGLSQTWFAHGSGQLGAALTVAALWTAARESGTGWRRIVIRGALAGATLSLIVVYAVDVRRSAGGYGVLDEVLFPLLVIGIAVGAIAGWIRWGPPGRAASGGGWALALAIAVGAVIPAGAADALQNTYRWVQGVNYRPGAHVVNTLSQGELEAMLWLRSNSDPSDVIVTNVHCQPPTNTPNCNARGFWVVGLSGRRAVLEGWAYTDEAQELQGVGGRIFSNQPAPFVERAQLNDAAMAGDVDALATLVDDYGVRWIVAVHRAGAAPDYPGSVAAVRFDNGEVTILAVETGSRG